MIKPTLSNVACALALLGILMSSSPAVAARDAAAPWQFIAKMYTEALGRAPEQRGWQDWVDWFERSGGCNAATLRAMGSFMYTGPEYQARRYDNPAKILSLYRGALSREPDQAGFDHWMSRLRNGDTWEQVVSAMFDTREFRSLVRPICSGHPYGWRGKQRAIQIPTSGAADFSGGTGADLQAILDSTPAGGTVTLAQKAVVYLARPLVVPPGVTLTTVGNLDSIHYALMGRLVRDTDPAAREGQGDPSTGLIKLQQGSRLVGVWVDGRAAIYQRRLWNNNVSIFGCGAYVANNRFSDSAGGTNVYYSHLGAADCANMSPIIEYNLFTSYANSPRQRPSDAIGTFCNDTIIRSNAIVDTTDVSIAVFHVKDDSVQRSKVYSNTIVNASNSASSFIIVDPLLSNKPPAVQRLDFSKVEIHNNLVWTSQSPATHVDVAFSLGSRAWYGRGRDGIPNVGFGASLLHNTSGAQGIRTNTGILVSGMLDAQVQANNLRMTLVNSTGCPLDYVVVSDNADDASGNIQNLTRDHARRLIDGCIGH